MQKSSASATNRVPLSMKPSQMPIPRYTSEHRKAVRSATLTPWSRRSRFTSRNGREVANNDGRRTSLSSCSIRNSRLPLFVPAKMLLNMISFVEEMDGEVRRPTETVLSLLDNAAESLLQLSQAQRSQSSTNVPFRACASNMPER
jgi:hypothetical protein